MIASGLFEDAARPDLHRKPYRIDTSLDITTITINTTGAVDESTYIPLPDARPFYPSYAIADVDQSDRVLRFEINGLLDDYLRFGATAIQRLFAAMRPAPAAFMLRHHELRSILTYLLDHLPRIDDDGRIITNEKHAYGA